MKLVTLYLVLVSCCLQISRALYCYTCSSTSKEECERNQQMTTCPATSTGKRTLCISMEVHFSRSTHNNEKSEILYRRKCSDQCQSNCKYHKMFSRPCQVKCCTGNGCNTRKENKFHSARFSNGSAKISSHSFLVIILAIFPSQIFGKL